MHKEVAGNLRLVRYLVPPVLKVLREAAYSARWVAGQERVAALLAQISHTIGRVDDQRTRLADQRWFRSRLGDLCRERMRCTWKHYELERRAWERLRRLVQPHVKPVIASATDGVMAGMGLEELAMRVNRARI